MLGPTPPAVVIIGRNEGERLRRCLRSIPDAVAQVIYVDSGSSDNSVEVALEAGAQVVDLDMSSPFTAARARNAGYKALENNGAIDFVQFVDGDCEFDPGWFSVAEEFLRSHPKVAVVCGRRREMFPETSVYNRLCDWEWDTPVGRTKSCGGDAMFRADAFEQAEGFLETMIAGEEPELCVRIRAMGWDVWRLNAEMTMHDAAIDRFSQWWKRARRSGHAFAEGAEIHGKPPEYHNVRALRRILKWAVFVPFTIVILAVFLSPWALLLGLVYLIQVSRLAFRSGVRNRSSWEFALFLTLGNFPEALGCFEYFWRRFSGRKPKLIEYK